MAPSTERALAYSKFFMAILTNLRWLFEQPQNVRGRDWQTGDSFPNRIRNGVGDRGSGRNSHWLTDSNDAALRHILKNNINFRYISGAWQLVGFEVWIQDDSCLAVQNSFLVQREANTHDDPSVDLAYASEPIDDQTTVLDTDNPFHSDQTGFRIHF